MEERQLDFSLPLLSVKHNRQQSLSLNKSINEQEKVKNSATVPFHWEQFPGKPKQEVGIHVQTTEEPSNIQTKSLKVPPGRESGSSSDQNILHFNCEDESDSESGDDRYSVDKRSRDLMTDRFLPAVKDVVLETRDYFVEKPSVVNEHCSEYADNVGSEEQRNLVPVKKSGKSWESIARFCAKNNMCLLHKLPRMRWKLHSSTRNANADPLEKDLPQIENKLILDESSLKSAILDGLYKKLQDRKGHNIALSRKLFKSLQDVPRNQVNVRGFGPMNNDVEKSLYVDFLSKSDMQNFDQESDGHSLESDYQRQFDPSSLTPPLPKSPSESWLWRTIVKTSNLEGLIPDAFDGQEKP
ncbi:hypothetical protein CDL12_18635 [Handroanthus impetiginosus]|uniref:Uncharacterized protein n=1 Tax=Handroanthus impetiginosus TaxID=429701 RepID=A0A2G9GUT5_9LAMI|nr:hypothetical protein CDL12_18635 [Handroanthus impetiginosus]